MTEADSSALKTQRIRLITLNQFPTPTDPETVEMADRFAAHCAVFENHYLQHPQWANAACSVNAKSVGAVASGLPESCRAVFFSQSSVPDAADQVAWREFVSSENPTIFLASEDIARRVTELHKFEFVWLHFDLPGTDSDAAFRSILQALEQVREDEAAISIVTAVEGSSAHLPTPFSSLAPENALRVPLWIDIPHREGCTIQATTGTSDIVFTIEQQLHGVSAHTQTRNGTYVFNLTELASDPGGQISRTLVVLQDELRAVRTSEFLFARTTTPDDSEFADEPSCGLYAKPEDVWNIHDVSGEYEAVAAELAKILDQSNP